MQFHHSAVKGHKHNSHNELCSGYETKPTSVRVIVLVLLCHEVKTINQWQLLEQMSLSGQGERFYNVILIHNVTSMNHVWQSPLISECLSHLSCGRNWALKQHEYSQLHLAMCQRPSYNMLVWYSALEQNTAVQHHVKKDREKTTVHCSSLQLWVNDVHSQPAGWNKAITRNSDVGVCYFSPMTNIESFSTEYKIINVSF